MPRSVTAGALVHPDQPESKPWYIYIYHQEWLLVRVGGKGEECPCANDTLFSCCTPESCLEKMKNILRNLSFSPVWPLRDLAFSLIYSPRIIKSWQLCFTHSLMPCQHWMWVAHHHLTNLNSSYCNQQICLHLKCSLCRIVDRPFYFCTQFSIVFFCAKYFCFRLLPVSFFFFFVLYSHSSFVSHLFNLNKWI